MALQWDCGCELAGVFMLCGGVEVRGGCGMRVFCKHFGMPKWGGMCCVY